MAKTKEEKEKLLMAEKENITNEDNTIEPTVMENTVDSTPVANEEVATETTQNIITIQGQQTGPSYNELLNIIQQLSNEVQALKSNNTQSPQQSDSSAALSDILSTLANRKSDREVSIVHNCELIGGLTTHLDLSNTSIDFTHVGETRLLSWQQFEECAAKYRSFFERRVILIDSAYAEVAQKYGLPCAEGTKHILTQSDIAKLPTLSVPELEKFIESLEEADKVTVFNYWLGKCYSREEGFYDRYKMDTLNRLSNNLFDNILLVMNGDSRA